MIGVSEAFLRAIRGSHRILVEARVVDGWQTGDNPTGTVIPVADGDVQLDGTADVRGTLDLTTAWTWPDAPGDLLAPYGAEVFVRRGVDFGGGHVEWCPLGYYRIQQPEQDNAPSGAIRLSGQDRMAGIIDARFWTPVQVTPTQTYGAVVTQLVQQVYPHAVIQWDDGTNALPIGRSIVSEDRHGFIDDLITSAGKVWWWDAAGVLQIRTPPSSATSPVWTVDAGRGGVLVSMSRSISRQGVYNAVIASGEAGDTNNPPSAVAVDDNPSSPTYYYGGFGQVPEFYSSPLLTTVAQCQQAARTMLAKLLGAPLSVSFAAVPNPALEPWDVVKLRYPGRSEVHVLKTVTIPLTASGAVQCATREQATLITGGA